MCYPFLDVRSSHHPASTAMNPKAYERITKYYVSQFGLPDRAACRDERRGRHSARQYLSCSFPTCGPAKSMTHAIAILQAGNMGGTLETGRVLNFSTRRRNRKLCKSLSLAHGSDECEARHLRRRDDAIGDLAYPKKTVAVDASPR